MTLEFSEDVVDGITVVTVTGRLDSNSAYELEQPLFKRINASPAVVIDMSGVLYVSSAGLRVLLGAAKIARAAGHRLALCGMTPQVGHVLELSGFSRVIETHETRLPAIRALR